MRVLILSLFFSYHLKAKTMFLMVPSAYVREFASHSSKIQGFIHCGKKVKLGRIDDNWGSLSLSGKKGYVMRKFFSPKIPKCDSVVDKKKWTKIVDIFEQTYAF